MGRVQGFWCHGARSKLLPGSCCTVSMLVCNMHQHLVLILIFSTPTQIPFHCSDHDSIPSLPFYNPLIPTLQFSFSLSRPTGDKWPGVPPRQPLLPLNWGGLWQCNGEGCALPKFDERPGQTGEDHCCEVSKRMLFCAKISSATP